MNRIYIIFLSMLMALLPGCSREGFIDEPSESIRVLRDECRENIVDMREDGQHTIWMRTSNNGLYRVMGRTVLHYVSTRDDAGSLSSNMVNDFETGPDGVLWVATSRGVDSFDRSNDVFVHYSMDRNDAYIREVLFDGHGNVYARSWRALFKFDDEEGIFRQVMDLRALTQEEVTFFFDTKDNVWASFGTSLIRFNQMLERDLSVEIGATPITIFTIPGNMALLPSSAEGLQCLDMFTGEIVSLPPPFDGIRPFSVNSAGQAGGRYLQIITDRGKIIYDRNENRLHSPELGPSPFYALLARQDRAAFILDNYHNLWYSLERGGFRTETFLPASRDETPLPRLLPVLQGRSRNSTISDGNSLVMLLNGHYLTTYDIPSKEVIQFLDLRRATGVSADFTQLHLGRDGRLLVSGRGRSNPYLISFCRDEEGRWTPECRYDAPGTISGTFDEDGGVWAFGEGSRIFYGPPPSAGQTRISLVPVKDIPPVNDISYATQALSLLDGRLLFGPTNNNPVLLDPADHSISEIPVREGSYAVYWNAMFEDSHGDIWLADQFMGIFHYITEENRVEHIPGTEETGTAKFAEDDYGNVIIQLSDRNVYLWRRDNGEMQLLWSDLDGISSERWFIHIPSEGTYMYDGQGLISLYNAGEMEETLTLDTPVVVVLSSKGMEVASFTSDPSAQGQKIRLKTRTPLDDASLFLSPGLQGLGRSYVYHICMNRSGEVTRTSSITAEISLHSMHYGHNRIRFRVSSADGRQSSPVHTLQIWVQRPLWMYLTLAGILLLVSFVTSMMLSLRRRNLEIKKEKEERELQERLNLANIDFFANISHEFRSPLTLINGALTALDGTTSPQEHERLVAQGRRNVTRMLNLVSQLMDFNKLEHGNLPLNVTQCDISALLRNSWEAFKVGAQQKNIDLHLNGCEEDITGWVDMDKVEKILWNLLSNSLKFTPPGGEIDIDCQTNDNILKISILDTGIGLEEEKIPYLFDRFEQSLAAKQAGGTGIGLFYAKSLTLRHHGNIGAANRTDGPGSVFHFSIPIDEDSYSEEEKAVKERTKPEESPAVNVAATETGNDPAMPARKESSTVLVIDDDYELVHYLNSFLSREYNVAYRFDAMSGYKLVKEIWPDVIICDIMMMDVSGLEFCKMVKENLETCHIPVIMLTARTSVTDQIKALDVGADAFVVKPFNEQYLVSLVNSMIDNRRRMRQSLASSTATKASGTMDELNPRDRDFMDKVYKHLETKLGEGGIDIDEMAMELGVSRSKFYYKIKGLTGQTPGDFFMLYRLNRAAQILKESNYKISAVAAMTGFNSPSHFSSLFKKQFGILPSQYVQAYGGMGQNNTDKQ